MLTISFIFLMYSIIKVHITYMNISDAHKDISANKDIVLTHLTLILDERKQYRKYFTFLFLLNLIFLIIKTIFVDGKK